MGDVLTNLINTYHELNANVVDELREEPSPLEFMRYVASNRPFVVRGAASDWKASQRWSAEYLKKAMGDQRITVAVTPTGHADAVVEQDDGTRLFVEPLEVEEPFSSFLDGIRQTSLNPEASSQQENVKYAQAQNDCLRNEFPVLYEDVPKEIPFARIALDKHADAINVWVGSDASVTALHRDNYENIYVQIRGQKHFVLLPPVEMPCINEQMLRKARYAQPAHESGTTELQIEVAEDEDFVPVALWDPDLPDQHQSAYSELSIALRVTLNEGDIMYLPALWYHKVSQSCGEEGFVAAVNYWYDMEFAGGFWAGNAFVRDVLDAERMKPQYPAFD